MAKVLLGFMGLANRQSLRWTQTIDMMPLNRKRFGMSIADFFAEKGEDVSLASEVQ